MSLFSLLGFPPHGKRPGAAHARLGLERFEDRQLLSATIGGIVYHDANNNGLREGGEAGIGNSQIALRDASGQTIARAVTDAQGAYQFTTNEMVGTAPVTRTVLVTFDSTKTGWTRTMQVEQFDPALGTLTEVEIVNTANLTTQMQYENLDAEAAAIATAVNGSITLSGPGLTGLIADVSAGESVTLAAFDEEVDFEGASAHDSGLRTASSTESMRLTGAGNLSPYIGTGTFALTGRARAATTTEGPGNILTLLNTSAAAEVQVIYHYIPSNELHPGEYTIVQTSQPTGYLDGQEARDGSRLPGSAGQDVIPVTVTQGNFVNNNFGEITPASLSGHVYLDLNNNGVREGGEPPIPGVSVRLNGTNDLSQVVQLLVQTGGDGSYRFDNLRPGSYTISETQPGGYLDGQESIGTAGGTQTNDQFFVTLAQGQNGANYDFGEGVLPSIPQVTPPIAPPPVVAAPPGTPFLSKIHLLSSSFMMRRR